MSFAFDMLRAPIVVVVGVMAATSQDLLEKHSISLGTVCTVAGIIIPAVWWMSRKFTKMDYRFMLLEQELRQVRDALGSLPCPEIVPKVAKVLGVKTDECKKPNDNHEKKP